MRYYFRGLTIALAIALSIATALPAVAQNAAGSIRGIVADEHGAVIQNASVTITNKATGEVRNATTGSDGLYSAENLSPGDYEVKVQLQGFAIQVLSLTVRVGNITSGDISMRVGAANEVVEVVAAAPTLDRQNYKIDGVITRERIEQLPLNGRSFLSLALLEPGISVDYDADPGAAPNNFFRVSIAGAASQLTRISVDGATVNDRITGGTSQNFSQETVEEFQISSFNFDLSSGNTASGAVNIVSRTGSNEFHGSGFLFYRDSHLAAFPGFRRPCDPGQRHPNCGVPEVRDALEHPFFARRSVGFNLGGPIKKDKLLWFTNFENISQAGARTITHTDPIFFAFNHIGQPLLKGKLFNGRLDYTASQKHKAFLRYSQDTSKNFAGGGSLESTWQSSDNWASQGLTGLTSVFSSRLVNDLRFSYSVFSNHLRPPSEQECSNPAFCFGLGGPRISISGGPTIGNDVNVPQNRLLRTYQLTDNFNWQRGSHRVRFGGNWEHLYGVGSWARIFEGIYSLFSPTQVATQNPALFAALPLSLRVPGSAVPTFQDLLKLPVSGTVVLGVGDPGQPPSFNRDKAARNDSYRLYFQDGWQIKSNFTLNYGLAWSFEDNIVSHDLDKPEYLRPVLGNLNPTRQDYNNFQPAVGFAWSVGKNNKTVIRGGAGIYNNSTNLIFTRLGERGFIGPAGNGLITVNGATLPNPLFGQPGQPRTIFTTVPTALNGEQLRSFLPDIKQVLLSRWNVGQGLNLRGVDVIKQATGVAGESIFDSDVTTGVTYHTTFGLQRELAHNMALSVDFVHRRAVHFGGYDSAYSVDVNNWEKRRVVSVNPTSGAVTSVRDPVIPECTGTQASIPKFPCSTGPIQVYRSALNARYVGLFVRFDRYFSRGVQFTGSYALSRYYTWNGIIDFKDLDASYGRSGSDRPHRFTFSGIWDLPDVRKGPRWARSLANDWQLSLISQVVSPPPLNVTVGSFDLEGDGSNTLILPGLKFNAFGRSADADHIRALVAVYNTTIPTTVTGKRTPRNQVVPAIKLPAAFSNGDTFISQDLRVTRIFPVGEHLKLSLIAEGFNIFNIANLTGFSGTLDPVAGPGQVQRASFGQPTDRVNQVFGTGGPRAFQVAARLSW